VVPKIYNEYKFLNVQCDVCARAVLAALSVPVIIEFFSVTNKH